MAEIKVKKVPERAPPTSQEILATFCFYYQQYTYEQAKQLPYRRISSFLKIARKQQAQKMLDLTRVIAGASSSKGLENVLSYFNGILEE